MEVDLFFRKQSGQKPEKGEKVDWGTRFGTGFLSFFGLILVLWGPLLLSSLGGEMQTLGNLVNSFSVDLHLKTINSQLLGTENVTDFSVLLTSLEQRDVENLPCSSTDHPALTWWWQKWFPDSLGKNLSDALRRPIDAHHLDYEKRCSQDCVSCIRQHVQRVLRFLYKRSILSRIVATSTRATFVLNRTRLEGQVAAASRRTLGCYATESQGDALRA